MKLNIKYLDKIQLYRNTKNVLVRCFCVSKITNFTTIVFTQVKDVCDDAEHDNSPVVYLPSN